MSEEVTVRYGINNLRSETFVGMTTKEVRDIVAAELNLASGATTLVNGESVPSGYRLQAGDVVTFVKTSGSKG